MIKYFILYIKILCNEKHRIWSQRFTLVTCMHSSRMRTARLLTVSQHALCRWGVYPSIHWAGGVCPGGYLSGGYLPGGCLPGGLWQTPPCEENDWQRGVKTLPCRNFVVGGNNWGRGGVVTYKVKKSLQYSTSH